MSAANPVNRMFREASLGIWMPAFHARHDEVMFCRTMIIAINFVQVFSTICKEIKFLHRNDAGILCGRTK